MTPIETALLVLVILLLLVFLGTFIYFLRRNKSTSSNNVTSALTTQLEDLKKQYSEINKTLQDSKVDSAKNITELNQRVEGMDKFQRDLNKFNQEIKNNLDYISNTAKDIPSISVELKDITNIYKHTKQRGNFGEFQLKTILDDIFGSASALVREQEKLKNGVVDFLVQINDNCVPIDSKFPLDNYKKINETNDENEIKIAKTSFKRDVISKFKEVEKYISKSDGINNVIVFIPSERIFSDIIDWYGTSILIEANSYNVFLASPTTITAILKLFVAKENDRQLTKNLVKVKTEMVKIFEYFRNIAEDWNAYVKTLATLTNKAKTLTNTNIQLLKRVKHIESDNQNLLDEVNKTIQSSIESKNNLESEKNSLEESKEEI